MPKLSINNLDLEVPSGTTVLEAARAAGIRVPTLCHMEGRAPQGACRVCVVEVEGAKTLMAACATPAAEGMRVHTSSRRVRAARRAVVDLILSEHEGNCQFCDRALDCELKTLAAEVGLAGAGSEGEPRYAGEKPPVFVDESTAALVRDTGKCIKCRRCVTACGEIQNVGALFPQGRGYKTVIGPAFAGALAEVACVQCGQCAAVCPVGAISERDHIDDVWAALDDPELTVVVQTAPAIRAALGECFGYPPGTLVTGKMVSALRAMGFDAVFDTNFTADLTIMEEGTELLQRLTAAVRDGTPAALPMFTSCSPGWINFAELFFPEFLPNLSSCKSPQQMLGAVAKSYYAEQMGIDPRKLRVVSVMPCTAKKYEAARPEMEVDGLRDVDYVLSTRELGRMIRAAGIVFQELPDGTMDSPLGTGSGAADIFANTGGVMEAALRTVHEIVTGRELPAENLHVKEIAGLNGIKEAAVTFSNTLEAWRFLEGVEARVAVAHGLHNAATLLQEIASGARSYHFVEVMTCPGGCIGGGGQPRTTTDEVRRARLAAIYAEDEGKSLRKSHLNPDVQRLYREYLGQPLGERSHHLLHTHYVARDAYEVAMR